MCNEMAEKRSYSGGWLHKVQLLRPERPKGGHKFDFSCTLCNEMAEKEATAAVGCTKCNYFGRNVRKRGTNSILVVRCAMKWPKKKLQRRLIAQSAIILAGTSERWAQIRF
jgi:hypothetical protein